jgi:hypothetical protein
VATLDASVAVRRNEREGVDARALDRIRDDVCRVLGEVAQAPLLPGCDERPDRAEVGDGGARGGEREPPARTFEAAGDRPRGRRATASATRSPQARELGEAPGANSLAEAAASHAPTRKEQIEEHIGSTVRSASARVGAGSAPKECRCSVHR